MDAARLVANRGYTNIMVFRDGIPGWEKAGFATNSNSSHKNIQVPTIEPAELNKTLSQYTILDVRPKSLYTNGYLPDSRAIPLAYLSMLSVELPKTGKIVVVDHKGKQCGKAAQFLLVNGFSDVRLLKGGLTAYVKAGYELEH